MLGGILKFKVPLLIVLIIPCWIIAVPYSVDLVVLYRVSLQMDLDLGLIYSQRESGFFYGPISLLLIDWMNVLNFQNLIFVWSALNTIALGFLWWSIERLFPILETPWIWIGVWAFSINPVHNCFQSGNIQLMLASLLMSCEYLTRSKRPSCQVLAGMGVALAAAIKIYPAFICLFYLVSKNRRVLFGMIAGALLSILLPFAFFGWESGVTLFIGLYQSLISYPEMNTPSTIPDILCLPSFLSRIAIVLGIQIFSHAIIAVVSFLSLGFFVLVWMRRKDRTVQTELWALCLALMILINPSTRVHYFVLLIPGLCSALKVTHSHGLWRAVTILAFSLLALTTEGVVGKTWNNFLEWWSVPTIGIILLCVIILFHRQIVSPSPNILRQRLN